MKKISMLFCVVLLISTLGACNKTDKESKVVTKLGESDKFSEEEIRKAISTVENNTNIPKITLTKVWYDEETSDKYAKLYLENGKGKNSGIKPENVIVLLSNFDVDNSATSSDTVMISGKTYNDYQWTLIKDIKTNDWKIDEWGY